MATKKKKDPLGFLVAPGVFVTNMGYNPYTREGDQVFVDVTVADEKISITVNVSMAEFFQAPYSSIMDALEAAACKIQDSVAT